MTINPLRRAIERGRQQGRTEAISFLRAQADVHHGKVGDQRRRAALNVAATKLEQGKPVGRP